MRLDLFLGEIYVLYLEHNFVFWVNALRDERKKAQLARTGEFR